MLYISTALYCEAKPLISHYQLKKSDRFSKFQVFVSDDITLIITGVGEIAASVAIACVCSINPPKEGDFYLSFGTCAASSNELIKGEIYLLNKIIQQSTGHTLYPDVLLKHSFLEMQGVTGGNLLRGELEIRKIRENLLSKDDSLFLYDMESAASYISASYFFQTHQMAFLRIVSDFGISNSTKDLLPSKEIMALIVEKFNSLTDFVDKIKATSNSVLELNEKAGEDFVNEMQETLHLSVSMKNSLRQHVRYFLLTHEDLTPILNWSRKHIPDTINSKKEGKIYFEELKGQLL